MSSAAWYTALVGAVAVERLLELRLSVRHARWAFERGGVETGRGHYPWMVALHSGLLVACVAEVWVADRPFLPWLGWPMLALVLLAQALRWWCIATLGVRWNTRVIVVPGLPLVHTAWVTTAVFTVLNAWLLLGFRIPCEERALAGATGDAGAAATQAAP